MKKHGSLFSSVFSHENIYMAYLDARKNKRNRRCCFQFEKRLGYNLKRLHDSIHENSYHPEPYFEFTVYEPKKRTIFAPAFADLVVQHAIYRIVYPVFNPTFIDQSFACRKGKGTHKAADYAQRALQLSRNESYTLKLDIRKFFYSIDRSILEILIKKRIKDSRLVNVMMMFADYGNTLGIPIGNLLSQLYALIYLNPLDHYVKRVLKVKLYCRYVDDFIMFDLDKDQAIHYLQITSHFLQSSLHLQLSKWTLQKKSSGVNFVGYRTWAGKRFLRKRALYVARRSMKKGNVESLVSCLGHARKTHSLQHLLTLTRSRHYELYTALPDSIRRLHYSASGSSV